MCLSWRSLPMNGGSRPADVSIPPTPETTRNARNRCTASALPFSSCPPASSYATACSVERRVASPTNTVPGSAAPWIREAVFTRSPATIP